MTTARKLRILLAASEAIGYAKTGGLADVAGSLPRAMAERGHDCALILPLYRSARLGRVPLTCTDTVFQIPIGLKKVPGRIWEAHPDGSKMRVFLVEQPEYFERDDPMQGRGIYQYSLPNGQRRDYADNCERYIFFCRAVLEAIRLLDYWPDVLHANDWQTGLIPVYLKEVHGAAQEEESARRYRKIKTLLTIHNLAYQGVFWHWDMLLTGLDWRLFNHRQLEFYGQLSFLKAGIVYADCLSTVSPTYAREIQTPYFGCGLEGVLSERRDRLVGIVNGVDYETWDPAKDSRLTATYSPDTVFENKPKCKAALQRRYGLADKPSTPLLAMIARLVEQKGPDLAARAVEKLLRTSDLQFVLLGDGDAVYQRMFQELQSRFPDKVALTLGFDEALAHTIEAGADIFLMPSLYEPSGLNQLYSLKYGCVPIVRATGGLADTITDCTAETLAAGSATGFKFVAHTPNALAEAIERALSLYSQQPDRWRGLVKTGMLQDWSWQRSATQYEQLYANLAK